jgi:hypothetical protein
MKDIGFMVIQVWSARLLAEGQIQYLGAPERSLDLCGQPLHAD